MRAASCSCMPSALPTPFTTLRDFSWWKVAI
jgi:hypothetical protein